MSGKGKGEAFVKLPRDLLESEAFGSLGLAGFRVLRFLMIEHMQHGGRQNGLLLAPRRQLVAAGIGSHDISPSIEYLERVGLIDCQHGIGRRPSLYALTWLPMSDGAAPSNRWRDHVTDALAIRDTAKATRRRPSAMSVNKHSQPAPVMDAKAHSQEMSAKSALIRVPNDTHKARSECQTTLTTGSVKQHSLSRTSYQGGCSLKEAEEGGEAVAPVPAGKADAAALACRWPLGDGCSRPALPGMRMCAAHEARR